MGPYPVHLVGKLDVDGLVGQVRRDQEGMPEQCWESLWEEGPEKLDEEVDMHDEHRGEKPERYRRSSVVIAHVPVERERQKPNSLPSRIELSQKEN